MEHGSKFIRILLGILLRPANCFENSIGRRLKFLILISFSAPARLILETFKMLTTSVTVGPAWFIGSKGEYVF